MRIRALLGVIGGLLLAFTLGGLSSALNAPTSRWQPGDEYLLVISATITLAVFYAAFRRGEA